jgi:methionine-rich copper-binding protein CopC
LTDRLIRGAALAAPLLFAGFDAQAHAHLVKANPAQNTQVAAPKVIDLQFSEKLEGKFSGLDLLKADGTPVSVTSKAAAKSIAARPTAVLAPGDYRVMWRAVSVDGHKVKGQYDFTVK